MAMMSATRPAIRFETTVTAIDECLIVCLPERASKGLPSRGQVAVRGTLDAAPFATVVEPDGRFGQWIKLDRALQRATGGRAGSTVEVEIEPVKEWPEPAVPDDLQAALSAAPARIRRMWGEITPMARWEWVRWVNATGNPGTRRRRVEVSLSKMDAGKRRPCCFDLSACTDPSVSRNGRLREEPAAAED